MFGRVSEPWLGSSGGTGDPGACVPSKVAEGSSGEHRHPGLAWCVGNRLTACTGQDTGQARLPRKGPRVWIFGDWGLEKGGMWRVGTPLAGAGGCVRVSLGLSADQEGLDSLAGGRGQTGAHSEVRAAGVLAADQRQNREVSGYGDFSPGTGRPSGQSGEACRPQGQRCRKGCDRGPGPHGCTQYHWAPPHCPPTTPGPGPWALGAGGVGWALPQEQAILPVSLCFRELRPPSPALLSAGEGSLWVAAVCLLGAGGEGHPVWQPHLRTQEP